MSGITSISSLPPELLYTILSHALADILFDHLFVGALLLDVPNDHHPGMDEISSLGGVNVAWRATLHRILAALLHLHRCPNQDNDEDEDEEDVQSLPKMHRQMHRAHHHQYQHLHQLTNSRAHHPLDSPTLINHTPISIPTASASTINYHTIRSNATTQSTNVNSTNVGITTAIPSLQSYQRTLHTMQIALRDLVQHSIDTYRNEQDQDVTMGGGQANQTGVTTPTLLPPPAPVQVQTVLPPPALVQPLGNGNGNGAGSGTPPLVPHSIQPHPPHSIPPPPHQHQHPPALAPASASVSNSNPSAPTPAHNHLFGALPLSLLATAAGGSRWKQYASTLQEYATIPLFQAALCYSQAAVFTCGGSNSFSWGKSLSSASGGGIVTANGAISAASGAIIAASGASARMRASGRVWTSVGVRRPDLSTLVLTTPRLVAALEWVGGHNRSSPREDRVSPRDNRAFAREVRICPREVYEVVECGMGEVRERIEDAIQVCRWNDLLHAVFLRGDRSEEMLEALDGCFDDLEANASSIQMHHLLRSNLFKTVQTIARLGPISLGTNNTPLQFSSIGHGVVNLNLNLNAPTCSNGEIWRSRAGALAFRWMGRVVEWTGL